MSRRPSCGTRLRRDVVVLVAGLLAIGVALVARPTPAGAAAVARAPVSYPWSSLEAVAVWGGNVMVAGGWSFDPDTRGTIKILAAVDAVNTKLALSSTGGSRPDIAWSGRGNTGFGIAIGGLAPGPHLMCIAAQNVGAGDPWRLFGCRNFTVGNVNPIGSLEGVSSQGDRAVATGWTADPQTPIPNEVRIDVDGQGAARVRAQDVRNDVAAAYPGLGNLHGFNVTVPIGPGAHQVCATGLNLDVGVDVSLGCVSVTGYSVQPFGNFDALTVDHGQIIATGWAYDPGVGGTSTISAVVRHSPLVEPAAASGTAALPRPDVAAAYGIDPNHGFRLALTATDPGTNTVCLAIVNRGGGTDQWLGCANVLVGDRRPAGQVTAITPTAGGTGVIVRGTVSDPDAPGSAVTLHVRVDGQARPNVAANGAYSFTLSGLSSGSHSICLTEVDVAGSAPGVAGDLDLTCGAVSLATASGAVSIGTTGAPGIIGPVGPSASSPIAGVDRDDGLSVRLHDGSILWLWGDSSENDLAGNLKYFVSGTAAWSTAGQPRTTTDAVVGGAPVKFATPVSWGAPCNPGENTVDWPISASVQAQSATRDRVIVFLENVCLGPGGTGSSRGLAVADWTYDSASPPAGQPIVANILNQQIHDTRSYGQSSFLDPVANLVYAYSCQLPPSTFDLGAYGPCTVSRVSPDQVNVRAAYQYWTGSGNVWSSDIAQAGAMTMPDLVDKFGNDIPIFPVAAFTTRYDATTGLYVMAYSPWPGFTDQVVVRVATSPTGPWTAPVQVFLPGCHDSIGTNQYLCYAGTAQPQFNVGNLLGSNAVLGIGWYDQLVGLGPPHGGYLAGTVPFSVVKNP